MKYILQAWIEIIIAIYLIYIGEYIALLILAYVYFQRFLLAKRVDYNRKFLRYINLSTHTNFRLIRKQLKIEDSNIEEIIEQVKHEIGAEEYKQLEKEIKDLGSTTI
jgi:hypothetical protein